MHIFEVKKAEEGVKKAEAEAKEAKEALDKAQQGGNFREIYWAEQEYQNAKEKVNNAMAALPVQNKKAFNELD